MEEQGADPQKPPPGMLPTPSPDQLGSDLDTPLRAFLAKSPCPFALRARVAQCTWPDPRPVSARIELLADRLRELIAGDGGDLMALELHEADRLRTPLEAAALINALLRGLRCRDGECGEALTEGIETDGWDFEYAGERFFVSLFAPLYPEWHSRSSRHGSIGFVLFQPERSFRRFGVSSRHPRRRQLSWRVHRRFQRHGQDYDVDANSRTPKALRFVKPIDPGEPPIAWWRVPYEAEVG
jgi:hypothetical protein